MRRKMNYGLRYPYQDNLKDDSDTNYGAWIPNCDMELFIEPYNEGEHVREFIPRDYVRRNQNEDKGFKENN